MKRVTVSLTDERCVVLTQIAEKQRRTLGNLCSFLLSGAPECVESLTNSESGVVIDPDAAGDYAPERSCANSGAAVSAPSPPIAAPQCVVIAPSVPERVGSWQRYVPTTGSRASYLAQSDAHREYQILGEGNNPADFA